MELSEIFGLKNDTGFEETALKVFRYQARENPVYRNFLQYLSIQPEKIDSIYNIPFLPIQFFKTHRVVSSLKKEAIIFTSSATTGTQQSNHFVSDLNWYEASFKKGFEYFYGPVKDYTLLALLPGYLERSGSSLIYMMNSLIAQSEKKKSGFYLHNFEELAETLIKLEEKKEKTLLIGVSFALLDFLEKNSFELKNTVVMETGGMKGKRKELVREELHRVLCRGFGVSEIHSEYGMTELLSQAYSKGKGIFYTPPWMKVLVRDTEDAMTMLPESRNGGINVIDLANINSCSFIATQDLGKTYKDGSFEVLGRFDHSDIRGCNLLVL
jgi:hypothetical protein